MDDAGDLLMGGAGVEVVPRLAAGGGDGRADALALVAAEAPELTELLAELKSSLEEVRAGRGGAQGRRGAGRAAPGRAAQAAVLSVSVCWLSVCVPRRFGRCASSDDDDDRRRRRAARACRCATVWVRCWRRFGRGSWRRSTACRTWRPSTCCCCTTA